MKTIKNTIKAVIFDMDGTIINTEGAWRDITYDFLKEAGITALTEKDHELIKALTGVGLTPAAQMVKDHFGLMLGLEEIIARKKALAQKAFDEKIEFIHGFEDFHQQLRENEIPSGIATNATPENLAQLARSLQFEKFFGDKLFCSGHVNFIPKPDPALFLFTAEKLGVKPEECVVFEDSIHGFKAAQAAGMSCIAVKNPLNEHLLDMVHGHIDSYNDAVAVLSKVAEKQKK